jgi:hypothetical protein
MIQRFCVFVLLFFVLFVRTHTAMGNCFFPTEFQGEFMTQASSRGGPNLQYAPITILPETIPIWGVCHRRFGNRVILVDRYTIFYFFKLFCYSVRRRIAIPIAPHAMRIEF